MWKKDLQNKLGGILSNMPKKKIEKYVEIRTMSKRAASKEAMKQMHSIISEQSTYESPEATLEITSDDEEVVTVDVAPKRKYRLTHRKSSDGNARNINDRLTLDRDVLVLKNIGWKEETLKLEAWPEDLSPAQLDMRNKATNEIETIDTRLQKLLKDTGSEVVYEGDNTALYDFEKEIRERTKSTPQTKTNVAVQPSKNNNQNSFQLVMDTRSRMLVGTMTPTATVVQSPQAKPQTRKRTRASTNSSPVPTPPAKIMKQNTDTSTSTPPPPLIQQPQQQQQRPTEATAVGGLSHGSNSGSNTTTGSVVDLTSDVGRSLADSREIAFNKIQGKTFPSLVVVARPYLRLKDLGAAERAKLDNRVKAVLMHAPTKFTEWLIQQGLIRSEQSCTLHPRSKLKLGMYSDVSKFPFSGGYVWISECCPQRFVSVFSGSLFEGSPHPPSVILKLIYHWSCQTNVQNVIQWVKVDNLYVKGLNTWLRSACTVALHTHLTPLGGPGKKVEVGVISLGTTSQDGHQRQVKVEVLGVLETESRMIRLRAVEPLSDGDRNYKKRFSKILEPLLQWVHLGSTIVTDLTVDKITLHSMGFKYVMQTATTDGVNNHTVMEYLRRIVPRMFQNTLSLLSRQIIQQFLDELVWREWFGATAAMAFDNIILHLADQTRVDTGQPLTVRLNKVGQNPFKSWSIKHYLNFHANKSHTSTNNAAVPPPLAITEPSVQKRIPKRKVTFKSPSPPPDLARPVKSTSPDIPDQLVPLEHYYYGRIDGVHKADVKVILNLKCNMCKAQFTNNIKLMTHLFTHAHNATGSSVHQCCYCLSTMASKDILEKHVAASHPTETRSGENLFCIICESKFQNTYSLGKHMSKEHVPSELPYQCGVCHFRCSSHKQAVDHFYITHNSANTMQCPFCLKTTSVCSNGRMLPQNLGYFLQHLCKHQKKSCPKKCSKCALWFVQKEVLKEHLTKMHTTQRRKAGLVPWPLPRVSIMVPKSRQEEPIQEGDVDISNVEITIQDNLKCRECSMNMNSTNHFPALLFCSNNNCQYSTCCRRAMNNHSDECRVFHSTLPVQRLPFRMYCVCGYNDTDGNLMAKHLTVCERKSAYPSEEAAKSATVTHSMLDVLGLVRRPEEPVAVLNEIMEIDSDEDKISKTQVVESRKKKKNQSGSKLKDAEKTTDDGSCERVHCDENSMEDIDQAKKSSLLEVNESDAEKQNAEEKDSEARCTEEVNDKDCESVEQIDSDSQMVEEASKNETDKNSEVFIDDESSNSQSKNTDTPIEDEEPPKNVHEHKEDSKSSSSTNDIENNSEPMEVDGTEANEELCSEISDTLAVEDMVK